MSVHKHRRKKLSKILTHIAGRVIDEIAESVGLDDPREHPVVDVQETGNGAPEPKPEPKPDPEEPPTDTGGVRLAALEWRKTAFPLAADNDGIRWDVAQKQLLMESEFAAFILAWWSHHPPAQTKEEFERRGLIAATVYHDVAIDDLPALLRQKAGE